jgi:hypothetical protein
MMMWQPHHFLFFKYGKLFSYKLIKKIRKNINLNTEISIDGIGDLGVL